MSLPPAEVSSSVVCLAVCATIKIMSPSVRLWTTGILNYMYTYSRQPTAFGCNRYHISHYKPSQALTDKGCLFPHTHTYIIIYIYICIYIIYIYQILRDWKKSVTCHHAESVTCHNAIFFINYSLHLFLLISYCAEEHTWITGLFWHSIWPCWGKVRWGEVKRDGQQAKSCQSQKMCNILTKLELCPVNNYISTGCQQPHLSSIMQYSKCR